MSPSSEREQIHDNKTAANRQQQTTLLLLLLSLLLLVVAVVVCLWSSTRKLDRTVCGKLLPRPFPSPPSRRQRAPAVGVDVNYIITAVAIVDATTVALVKEHT